MHSEVGGAFCGTTTGANATSLQAEAQLCQLPGNKPACAPLTLTLTTWLCMCPQPCSAGHWRVPTCTPSAACAQWSCAHLCCHPAPAGGARPAPQSSRPSAALSTARLLPVAWRSGAPAPMPRSGPGTEGNHGPAADTTGRLALVTLSLSPLPLLENASVALLWIAFEITPPRLPFKRHASCGPASCLPCLPASLPCWRMPRDV